MCLQAAALAYIQSLPCMKFYIVAGGAADWEHVGSTTRLSGAEHVFCKA